MSRVLLCLIVLALCCACAAPQPKKLDVPRQHEQEQADKAQELLRRHDKLLRDLHALQATRDHVAQEALKDYKDILDQCRANTLPEGTCAERFLHYRTTYRSVITAKTQSTIAALLTRYFYEEQKYDAAIQEGKTYLEGDTTEAEMLPAVLLYTALSHYNIGQKSAGHSLLKSLQERYPSSQEAEIVRKIFSGSPGR